MKSFWGATKPVIATAIIMGVMSIFGLVSLARSFGYGELYTESL